MRPRFQPIKTLFLSVFFLFALEQAGLADDAFGRQVSSLPPLTDPIASTRGNGIYGRFDGPWSPRFSALYEYQSQASIHRVGVEASLLYLQSIGAYLRGRLAPGEENLKFSPLLSLGLELEPFFLLRWQNGKEVGPALLDLVVDSIGLHAGLALKLPEGSQEMLSFGAEIGLGAGLPLMGQAEGLWLRTHAALLTGSQVSALIGLRLEWQMFVGDPTP